MDKKRLKKYFKEKWYLFLGTGVFLIAGIVALLVGFAMTGWSIIDWLKSPYAVTFFILIIIGLITAVVLFITYKRTHLGE